MGNIKFKANGVWKDAVKQFIKVNGVWKEIGKTLIKNGGQWVDASKLSDTKLDYDMTTTTYHDGTRTLLEKGDPTKHKASLHSGHTMNLSKSVKLEVPINFDGTATKGSVAYFNETTKKFEQPTLPLAPTYTLTNGKYGTVCKLHTNKFTQADLDAMDAKPELLISWYLGTDTLPSGIVKGADDKVYYPTSKTTVKEVVKNGDFSTNDISQWYSPVFGHIEVVNGQGKISNKGTGAIRWMGIALNDVEAGDEVSVKLDYDSTQTDGQAFTLYVWRDTGKSVFSKIYAKNTKGSIDISATLTNPLRYPAVGIGVGKDATTLKKSNVLIDNFSVKVKKVRVVLSLIGGSEELSAKGMKLSLVSPYGIQSLLLKEDVNGLPTGLAKANTIEGGSDGRFVLLPMVDPKKKKHLVTKCLKEIKGDITQVVDIECTP